MSRERLMFPDLPDGTVVSDWPAHRAQRFWMDSLSSEERERRFGGFDLERWYTEMGRDLFEAFTRNLGIITGRHDTDVVELCRGAER